MGWRSPLLRCVVLPCWAGGGRGGLPLAPGLSGLEGSCCPGAQSEGHGPSFSFSLFFFFFFCIWTTRAQRGKRVAKVTPRVSGCAPGCRPEPSSPAATGTPALCGQWASSPRGSHGGREGESCSILPPDGQPEEGVSVCHTVFVQHRGKNETQGELQGRMHPKCQAPDKPLKTTRGAERFL